MLANAMIINILNYVDLKVVNPEILEQVGIKTAVIWAYARFCLNLHFVNFTSSQQAFRTLCVCY